MIHYDLTVPFREAIFISEAKDGSYIVLCTEVCSISL